MEMAFGFFSQNAVLWRRGWSEGIETPKAKVLEDFNNKNLLYKDKATLEPFCKSIGTMN